MHETRAHIHTSSSKVIPLCLLFCLCVCGLLEVSAHSVGGSRVGRCSMHLQGVTGGLCRLGRLGGIYVKQTPSITSHDCMLQKPIHFFTSIDSFHSILPFWIEGK